MEAAVKPEMDAAAAMTARRAVIAIIEKESNDQMGLRSNVVTLYESGAYCLYRSKRFTDVRLVFAPEGGIAYFGGDPDNFEYPRYDLDICFFHAYETAIPPIPSSTSNGVPMAPPTMNWSSSAAIPGQRTGKALSKLWRTNRTASCLRPWH